MKQVETRLDGKLVTLLGGGGFVGRYVAQQLLAAGGRVRIAQRHPRQAMFLKPLGGLGQTQFVHTDVADPAKVARAIAGSDIVINLVGSFANMAAVNGAGAGHVAAAASAAGVGQLVHMSAIGADSQAASHYAQTKGEGETAVRRAFPAATIVRPSVIFGREDQFINRFAGIIRSLPIVPLIAPQCRLQPVHVADVASAVVRVLGNASLAGQTVEAGGPQILTIGELQRWTAAAIGRAPLFVDVPDFIAATAARLTGWLPGAPITHDQWLMLQQDNVVSPDAIGLAQLGIAPSSLATQAEGWLVQYRRHGRFAKRAAAA